MHCERCNMCVPKATSHVCVGGMAKDNPCPVCYQDLAESCDPAVFLNCGHALHWECAQGWMEMGGGAGLGGVCPLCRGGGRGACGVQVRVVMMRR